MSLILSYSGSEVKTANYFTGEGVQTLGLNINGVTITNSDMVDMIDYYLTNSDLDHEDDRLDLVERIKNYKIVDGYNEGRDRIVI